MNQGKKVLTVIGMGDYEPIQYKLGEKTSGELPYAPVALIELLKSEKCPWEVVAFLTSEASKKHEERLRNQVESKACHFKEVRIPAGSTEKEVWEIFEAVCEQIQQGDRVVVDVTHGFRSLPLLMVAALIFMKEVTEFSIDGVYYGNWEARDKEKRIEPVFDLSPLVDMVSWAHAARIFRKYGHADEIGSLLCRIQDEVFRENDHSIKPRYLKKLGGRLEELSLSLAEGLPLEVGKAAWELGKIDGELIRAELSRFAFPGEKLAPIILDSFKDKAIAVPNRGGKWKKSIKLDLEELKRQARLADWYLQRNQVSHALAIMREWMVNRVILAMGYENQWLDYNNARKPAERKLNVMAIMERDYIEALTQNQAQIGNWWRIVADARNTVHHCGLREEEVKVRSMINDLKDLWAKIKEKVEEVDFWNLARRVTEGVVLLSPLGLSKGLLYSALLCVRPASVVVITSKEAEGALPEILYKAQMSTMKPNVWIMRDPYCGFDEVVDLTSKIVPGLLAAEKVVANQTGGTTVMQFVIHSICRELRNLDIPVEEVALVDRRSPEEQRGNPYVVGELVILEQINRRQRDKLGD